MDLTGGSLLWKTILNFWPLQEEKDLIKAGIPEMNDLKLDSILNLKNCFSFELINSNLNNEHPILIIYCGMGKTLLPLKVFIYDLLKTLKNENKTFPIIYSIDHMKFSDLNELSDESYKLYNHVNNLYPNHKKLIIGHSLGSGIAAQVSKKLSLENKTNTLSGLLLLSTSPNLTVVLRPINFLKSIIESIAIFLLGNILDTQEALKKINTNVKIIHTVQDKMFLIQCIRPLKNIVSNFTQKTPIFEEREGNHGHIISDVNVLKTDILNFIKTF